MSKLFYQRLAVINIKKNSKTYFPFILTCICTIMMFYIMYAISINKGLDGVSGAASLKSILFLGTIVIGIFSAIFLFYTNSFLIKRRKKEIGLYNVLGLEKKHIAKILCYECIFTSAISLTVGLIFGIILNKLMFLLLIKMLNFKVPFGFSVSIPSLIKTLIVFCSIFFATLLSNLFQIKILKPIELLKGSEQGEKEPKTKWIMTIIGVAALCSGYGIALNVKSPLAALNLFFAAVILVMIGTYAIFTAASIAVLKFLRRQKNFYYKTGNFISVSGMMYRMKQNAVGLANICILSTAVLVMLSTTISLYVGMEDFLKLRYPRDIVITSRETNKNQIQKLDEILNVESKSNKVDMKDKLYYLDNSLEAVKKDGEFLSVSKNTDKSKVSVIEVIPISDYNRLEGKNITLNDDEVILFSKVKDYVDNTINIDNKNFKVKQRLDKPVSALNNAMTDVVDTYVIFVNNIDTVGKNGFKEYTIGFNINGTNKDILSISDKLNKKFVQNKMKVDAESAVAGREDFLSLYGGLFFLGIFLGTLFLMATVLIIYYKQISEGYEDKERFEIMQKVGMDKNEIKKTIRSQVLMVFFLPLVFTVIHIAFAFPMITKMLAVLGLKSVNLFILSTAGTIIVFAAIYTIVFSLTARVYYKIVE
ncbi:ABC transporter permease [Clostridium coskatii]|uniref:ABC transporter permease protein YxdM n=1 Tax=Clostridium coskatii TaxID=1705578 RepID=A0A166U2Y2_9CLOT|nr:ABC transporter permease [Clostridium coskatii]OAA94508.1 ABC transporter permease protein YxdM [Clostridium coskatii]OBR93252.1 ABC transporter permease protein YxdM [Clostridium coskatii]